jgi:uncharacterized paraquat-inducible protein A
MIELSPTTAIMLYLCLTLATLLAIWGFHHYSSRKKKMDLSHQKLHVCEYCHFAYLRQIDKTVSRCPQCSSFNKS